MVLSAGSCAIRSVSSRDHPRRSRRFMLFPKAEPNFLPCLRFMEGASLPVWKTCYLTRGVVMPVFLLIGEATSLISEEQK